jgi:hypothetical protein
MTESSRPSLERLHDRPLLWALGLTLGAAGAAASVGIVPAQVAVVLAAAAILVLTAMLHPLAAVTAVALPFLAVVSNLPAPLQIAERNLRYVFLVAPPLLALWMVRAVGRREMLALPSKGLLGGLVGALVVATVLRSPYRGTGLGTVLLLILNLGVYYLLVWAVAKGGTRELERSMRWLFYAVGAYVAGGMLIMLGHALAILPPGFAVAERDIADLASANVGGRVVMPGGFWTVTGSYFAATAVLAVGVFLGSDSSSRRAALLGMAAGLAGMVMSASRGPILGFMVGLVTLVVFLGRRHLMAVSRRLVLILLVMSLPTVAYIVVSSGARAAAMVRVSTLFDMEAGTTIDRLVLWSRMLADVRERPLLGHGADAYRQYRDPGYPAESFPVEILHSAGLIGFGCFALWMLSLARRAWRAQPDDARLAAATFAAFLGLNASVATNPGAWGAFYWTLGGLAAAASLGAGQRA